MVNPILATIISRSIKNAYKQSQINGFQLGGNGNNTETAGNNTETAGNNTGKLREKHSLVTIIVLFLSMISLIAVGDVFIKYVVSDDEKIKNKSDDEKLRYIKEQTYIGFSLLMVFYAVVLAVIYIFLRISEKDHQVKQLFCVSFGLMFIFIVTSYLIKVYKSKDKLYFYNYIGIPGNDSKTHNFDWAEFGVGLVTNIIFGFIDNLGLFYGMDSIDGMLNHEGDKQKQNQINKLINDNQTGGDIQDIVKKVKDIYDNPNDLSSLVTAGVGNTFSDFLGAFIGNAAGDIVLTLSNINKTPIISEIIGIVIGCLFGIFIPYLLKGGFKKKSITSTV